MPANAEGGYWIAEATRDAAVRHIDADDLHWAVLAADGARRTIDHPGLHWHEIAARNDDELLALLWDLHCWEPSGTLPQDRHPYDEATAWVHHNKQDQQIVARQASP